MDLRLEIRVVWWEFLAIKIHVFHLFHNRLDLIFLFMFVHQKSLKNTLKTGLLVTNNQFNLCGQVEISGCRLFTV